MLDKMRQAFNGETVILEHEIGNNNLKSWYTPHLNQQGEIIGLLGLAVNITEQKQAEYKILEYQNRLKDLTNEITITEEKVRKQIAVDLHDNVGQLLSSMRMQITRIIDLEKNPEIQIKINNISQGLLKAIQATRESIFNLSPPQLNEIGLYAAVHDWIKEQIDAKHNIKSSIKGEDVQFQIEENTKLLLFRSIRELVMNVVKHARAKQLDLNFATNKEMLEITVQDYGIGFNYNPDLLRLKSKTYGLFSIQERITDLGGSMEVDSASNKGTKIKLLLPIIDNKLEN
jgi:signal transduction histidine kinase